MRYETTPCRWPSATAQHTPPRPGITTRPSATYIVSSQHENKENRLLEGRESAEVDCAEATARHGRVRDEERIEVTDGESPIGGIHDRTLAFTSEYKVPNRTEYRTHQDKGNEYDCNTSLKLASSLLRS